MTLLILIFHYYINVCNNSLKETFNGDKSCLTTQNGEFPTSETSLSTYDAFKEQKYDLNYHSDYTCGARKDGNGNANHIFYSTDNSYTSDINAKNLLLTYNCVKYSPTEIKDKLIETGNFSNNDFSIIGHDRCITNDNQTLENIIVNELGSTYYTGPIYACIAQAPFLEDQKARGDIVSHGTSCYIKNKGIYGNCEDSSKSFKCHILLVKTNGEYSKIKGFVDFVKENKSNDQLCHLYCHKNNNLGCGCLNLENSYDFGGKQYSSVCLGPDDSNIPGVAPVISYSMIYFLNPYNDNVYINNWDIYNY